MILFSVVFMVKLSSSLKLATCATLSLSLLTAQRGGNDWMTVGNDVQRSFWIRYDGKISEQTMRKPGFMLVWKSKLNNTTRSGQALTSPALLDFYISYRGFRTLGFFGGSGDTTIGVDTDIARLEWQNGAGKSMAKAGTPTCPGGMTSTVTRPTVVPYPLNATRGPARANPARSGVGEPHAGSIQLQQRMAPRPAPAPAAPAPAAQKASRRATAPPSPFSPTPLYVNAITGDGMLHQMYVSNGEEPKVPVQFLKPGAHSIGLTAFDGHAYAATINNCGGVDNGVYAINRETSQVAFWKAPGKNIAGSTGFAVGPEGELYAASGNTLAALAESSLSQRAAYSSGTSEFITSPLVFEHNGKDLIAAATADGRVHVIESESMQAVATSQPVIQPGFAAGALASWQDESKTRWILVPNGNGITALKFSNNTFSTGWTSTAIAAARTPAIVNGVIFALAPGNARGSKAVLYAMESSSGKELWNSGSEIASYVTTGNLAAGGGRVYLSTVDNTQYAFGFYMEH